MTILQYRKSRVFDIWEIACFHYFMKYVYVVVLISRLLLQYLYIRTESYLSFLRVEDNYKFVCVHDVIYDALYSSPIKRRVHTSILKSFTKFWVHELYSHTYNINSYNKIKLINLCAQYEQTWKNIFVNDS